MSVTKDVIEAVVADLNANAGLAKHSTVKFRRPRAIMPIDCPMLVVWLLSKSQQPITTIRWRGRLRVGISWHEATVEEAQTLVRDDAIAARLMESIELIEDRARSWATDGLSGAPTTAEPLGPGDAEYLPAILEDGLVEGYVLEVLFDLTEE